MIHFLSSGKHLKSYIQKSSVRFYGIQIYKVIIQKNQLMVSQNFVMVESFWCL